MKTEMYCWLENRTRKALPSTDVFEQVARPGPDRDRMHRHAPRSRRAGRRALVARTCGLERRFRLTTSSTLSHATSACRSSTSSTGSVTEGSTTRKSRHVNSGANWRHLYELYLPPNELMLEHSWEGTRWLDLMVEEVPGDYYVRTKKRLSAFYPTDFEFLLRQLDVRTVVLTGTMTDACVLSSAFDAANRDFRVIVPRDIVAGYDEAAEHGALMVVSLHLGLVVDSPALLAEWYARRGKPLPGELEGVTDISEVAGPVPVGA